MRFIIFCLLTVKSALCGEIRSDVLHTDEIAEIVMSEVEPTTVILPFSLKSGSVRGGSVTTDTKNQADYLISYQENSKVIDLRALRRPYVKGEKKPKISDTFVNIVTSNNEVFVFKLIHDEKKFDSVVTYKDNKVKKVSANAKTPQALSIFIERSYTYDFLKKAKSDLVLNAIKYEKFKTQEFANGVKLKLDSIVRWKNPHPNCLVFNGRLINDSNEVLTYDRNSFKVLIGSKIYHASVAHCSGLLDKKSTREFQFLVSDTEYPELENINLEKNEFDFALTFTEEAILNAPLEGAELLPNKSNKVEFYK